ncbi:MAG: ADP-ribosylglycohydrolase family protein [Saccharospirillaceae bacterium]|nr:ADP-ribosylglycohydrolase family protein [Pseudomonadales bacterium]NRB79613.1 ADP-ribosylglycohydrolase family protein [Saccharospirillaceae bacterium]
MSIQVNRSAITNSLLGLMVGDTLGLPYEGLSAQRIAKWNKRHLFNQSLLLGKGMVSDDSEHALITARSLCHSLCADSFGRSLGWGLRWWFMRIPAGMGLATGRALIKLCAGFSFRNSGVYSAGNGPAMRAPILGVVYGGDDQLLKKYVSTCTRITHTDPKAYIGALAIAKISYMSSQNNYKFADFKRSMDILLKDIEGQGIDEFWQFVGLIEKIESKGEQGIKELLVSLKLDKGVSGYIYHTLPFILALFFVYKKDFSAAISCAIRCGGDTDTTAAIIGGVIGAGINKEDIDKQWLENICDYPCNPTYVEKIANCLFDRIEQKRVVRCPWLFGPVLVLRNMFFLTVVLLHGFRRLLPPY